VRDQPLQAVLAVDDDRKLIDEKCGSLIEEAILRAVSETTMTNLTIPHWRPSWTISGTTHKCRAARIGLDAF
jgi:hypothetical protein